MKKYILSIVLGLFAMAHHSNAQLELVIDSETTNTGGTVDVDFRANGFENLSVVQFSAGWDSLVMTFNSIVFTNPDLSALSATNFSGPAGAANVDEGQFSFSYNEPNANGMIDNGEILFTVRFNVVGDECAETSIDITDDPTEALAYDGSFNEVDFTYQPGTLSIDGPDCGGGGDDLLTIIADMGLTACEGENICIPLSVENFIAVQSGTGTILWDETVLTYTGIANSNLAEIALNDTDVENGRLRFLWSNPDPEFPFDIDDGDIIFEICFDVIGNIGETSEIDLTDQGSLGFEWFDDEDLVIPQDLEDGLVTVVECSGPPVTFNISDVTVSMGTTACVDVTVENFTFIGTNEYEINWDANVLSNAVVSNFDIGLNAGNFNFVNGSGTLSWTSPAGTTVDDNTVIYTLCFDAIGDCDSQSTIDFSNVIVADGNVDPITNVEVNAGSVTIICIEDCEVLNIDRPCSGEAGGNVTVDAPDNCVYSWKDENGLEVSTMSNLLGVEAGVYSFTATCNGVVSCEIEDVVIDDLAPLEITGDITNASCGAGGAISVMVAAGSGNYSYNWNPTLPNSNIVQNLDPGLYELTVTDTDSQCTNTASFVVNNVDMPLEIVMSNIIDESCNGNDGSINITVNGGCGDYDYAWSDASFPNNNEVNDLAAANYGVTVTDENGNSTTGSFVVDGIPPLMIDGTPIIVPSTGSDGEITIMISGGTPTYSYNWDGPTTGLPDDNMITGLAPGNYEVTVTDSQGCTGTFGPYVVPVGTGPDLNVQVGVSSDYTGFGVSCNGFADGIISGVILGGQAPFAVELSGDADRVITLNTLGTFTIDGLSAGTYNVTVSDAASEIVSFENIIITEPESLNVMIGSDDFGCDSGIGDGFIDVVTSGGVGVLEYTWSDPNLMGMSVDGLIEGSYTVLVTDENGCEVMETVSIEACDTTTVPEGCYEVREIITPNDDGFNDAFLVTCIRDFPAELLVYDRWGKLVYQEDSYNGNWKGVSLDGEDLIEGGYMYVIIVDFGQGRREIMKGTLTILRD